jgi:lysophospholipase L1-like esterase
MLRLLAFVFALAGAAPLAAQAPLPVHIGGRAIHEADGAWRFGWPGVYFESRFRGTGVTVAVESPTEYFQVSVDGGARRIVIGPGNTRRTITGLARGEHVVRLDKLTESQQGGGRFLGFLPVAGDVPLPLSARARRIEFIGDSYTVGYGNAAPGRTCTRQQVHDLTDTSRAFGPLLAARLDADYRINAYSGIGVVRNYDGAMAGQSMPTFYDRLIPGDPAPLEADANGWRPQLIIISLGGNDFSTQLHSGEHWATQEALRADWRAHYVAFARMLMARQPQARFLLMGHDPFFADVELVAAELNRNAARPVVTLHYGDLQLTGCDYHPSLADHRSVADLVAGAIGRIGGLWNPRQTVEAD